MQDDDGKVKKKGSSLKSSTLEPILKQFLDDVIALLLKDAPHSELTSLYHKYVIMASNITDIKPWSSKRSITERTINSERANETKVIDAIAGSEYVEGDRVYLHFREDGTLALAEKFDGTYDKNVYYDKLFKSVHRFETILDIPTLFKNYKLKKHKSELQELLNG